MEPNLNSIKISADMLVKEFNCSICFTLIEDCYTTKCGHLFCKACILESINRHHKCPFCQATLQENDVFRDFAMNNLRKIIIEERDRAQKEYIEELFNNMSQNKQQQANGENSLERIFLYGLKDIIINYQTYLTEIEDKFSRAKQRLRNENAARSNEIIKNSNQNASELLLTQKVHFDKELSILDENLKIMKDYIYNSLKNTLQTIIPDTHMLEIQCCIMIPSKNFKIDKIKLNPSSKTNSLKTELSTHFLKLNNPIHVFDDKVAYIGVVSPERFVELSQVINDQPSFNNKTNVIEYVKNIEKQYSIPVFALDTEDLLAKHKIPQNSILMVYTMMTLKNEAPIECMTYKYVNGTVMNYYSCENCKINWICTACSNHCHKGHSMVPYLTNHVTTWACCYCVSKGFCKALNKNSK